MRARRAGRRRAISWWAGCLRWAPRAGPELPGFWSRLRDTDAESEPLIFTSGDFLPKRFPRNPFYGQDWADFSGTYTNYGAVAKADPLGFDVRLGVFRSLADTDTSAGDLMFDTHED